MSTKQQLGSIDNALKVISNSIPPWWELLFSILKITNSVMDILGCVEDSALHFSLTQMFDDQLNELKRTNSGKWISKIEIEWCNAKLYLYALTFTIPTNAIPSHNIQIQIHRQAILHKALEAASNLVNELRELGQLCKSNLYPGGLLSFVPKPYFTALFNATTFLFRFMATSITSISSHNNRAMGLIVEAHKVFQLFPEQRELTRAAIHIEMLMKILRDGVSVNFNDLVVNNKLGASVMIDAVFQACRQRNINPKTGKALAVKEWKTVNETFASRLPQAPAQKTIDHDETVRSIAGYRVDLTSQPLTDISGVQDPQSWEAWDNYIDMYQGGVRQWGDLDIEQSTDGYDYLGEAGSLMYM